MGGRLTSGHLEDLLLGRLPGDDVELLDLRLAEEPTGAAAEDGGGAVNSQGRGGKALGGLGGSVGHHHAGAIAGGGELQALQAGEAQADAARDGGAGRRLRGSEGDCGRGGRSEGGHRCGGGCCEGSCVGFSGRAGGTRGLDGGGESVPSTHQGTSMVRAEASRLMRGLACNAALPLDSSG